MRKLKQLDPKKFSEIKPEDLTEHHYLIPGSSFTVAASKTRTEEWVVLWDVRKGDLSKFKTAEYFGYGG